MSAAPMELVFDSTAQDQSRARRHLEDLRFDRHSGIISKLWRPPWFWLLAVPCTFAMMPWLISVLDHFRHGVLPDGFGLVSALGLVWAIIFLGYEAKLILGWVGERLGLDGMVWAFRQRTPPARCRVSLEDDSVVVESETCRTSYRWTAITGIEDSKRAILLMLTPYLAVIVPKSAFATAALEQSFRSFVAERIDASA